MRTAFIEKTQSLLFAIAHGDIQESTMKTVYSITTLDLNIKGIENFFSILTRFKVSKKNLTSGKFFE